MQLDLRDVHISVKREPFDEENPNKKRGSTVICKHIPTGIVVEVYHISQVIAKTVALKELERKLAEM